MNLNEFYVLFFILIGFGFLFKDQILKNKERSVKILIGLVLIAMLLTSSIGENFFGMKKSRRGCSVYTPILNSLEQIKEDIGSETVDRINNNPIADFESDREIALRGAMKMAKYKDLQEQIKRQRIPAQDYFQEGTRILYLKNGVPTRPITYNDRFDVEIFCDVSFYVQNPNSRARYVSRDCKLSHIHNKKCTMERVYLESGFIIYIDDPNLGNDEIVKFRIEMHKK